VNSSLMLFQSFYKFIIFMQLCHLLDHCADLIQFGQDNPGCLSNLR
jgi:hypothetical protein